MGTNVYCPGTKCYLQFVLESNIFRGQGLNMVDTLKCVRGVYSDLVGEGGQVDLAGDSRK